jgi:hypothetical protein
VKPAVNRQPGLRRGNSQTSVVWQAMKVYNQLKKQKTSKYDRQIFVLCVVNGLKIICALSVTSIRPGNDAARCPEHAY